MELPFIPSFLYLVVQPDIDPDQYGNGYGREQTKYEKLSGGRFVHKCHDQGEDVERHQKKDANDGDHLFGGDTGAGRGGVFFFIFICHNQFVLSVVHSEIGCAPFII